MSDRPYLAPKSVITNVSMGASVTSTYTNINRVSIVSYTIAWTGTPNGTFTVEVSNDYVASGPGVNPNDVNSGTWVAVTLSTAVTATGSAGSAFIDVDVIGAAWIRLVYTRSSSTGTLNATVAGKVA